MDCKIDLQGNRSEGEANTITKNYFNTESVVEYSLLQAGRFSFLVPRCETESKQGMELVIRPEKICFVENQSLEPNTNTLLGRITEVIYVGENTRYVVETEFNQPMVVKYPNRKETQIRKKGDTVMLGWKPEDTSLVRKAD